MKQIRSRSRLAPRKLWMMRIMAGSAGFEGHFSKAGVPVTARASVNSGFPVAKGWPMATAAQRRAVRYFQLAPVASLQGVELRFVVTVEAVVVSTMGAVPHHDIFVFGRDDELA